MTAAEFNAIAEDLRQRGARIRTILSDEFRFDCLVEGSLRTIRWSGERWTCSCLAWKNEGCEHLEKFGLVAQPRPDVCGGAYYGEWQPVPKPPLGPIHKLDIPKHPAVDAEPKKRKFFLQKEDKGNG